MINEVSANNYIYYYTNWVGIFYIITNIQCIDVTKQPE